MDDKTKLKLLEHWKENHNIGDIPKELKDKITNGDVAGLILEVDSFGGVNLGSVSKYAETIRKKIKDDIEIESMELQNEVLKKQTDLQENLNKIQEEANTIIKKQGRVLWAQVGVTFVLILATIYLGWSSNSIAEESKNIAILQANISKIQTEILQKSNPSFEPDIQIIPDKEDLIIPAWEIAKEGDRELDADARWAIVKLGIYNLGSTDSQDISCNDKGWYYQAYFTPDSHFENIAAGTVNRTRLHIMDFNCAAHGECDYESLPLGKNNITLECDCIGCKTQREFETVINFCVYNRNASICTKNE